MKPLSVGKISARQEESACRLVVVRKDEYNAAKPTVQLKSMLRSDVPSLQVYNREFAKQTDRPENKILQARPCFYNYRSPINLSPGRSIQNRLPMHWNETIHLVRPLAQGR
jgi:hypothetical protein